MHQSNPLLERRVQHRGRSGADEAAEFRYDAGGASRLRAARLDGLDVHGEAIALAGAAYGDRAALRVQKRKLQLGGRTILLAGDGAAKRVLGLDDDDIARIDGPPGLGIGPVDIFEDALRGDVEVMT